MALGLSAFAACASSEVDQGAIDAPDTDAPIDAGIDAIDACVPVAESCNGADDDCDGAVDEDFATLGDPCTDGSGSCTATGAMVCDPEGTGVTCSAVAGTGGAETCNGIDDDCDGPTDEGLGVGTACDGADGDLCAEGMMICAAAGGGTVCSDLTSDTVETCDGADDDCDGATDEGFDLGMPCDGADSDACIEGTITCAGDGSATCSDLTVSTVEVCNGLDDDCRNGADDGFAVGGSCSAGVGACNRPGTYVCNGPGTGVVCDAVPAAATAETCGDGIDQDCNGADIACPTNDFPTGAINISAGGVFTADLVAAHNDQDFTGTGCGFTGGRDVYYTFSLPAAEVVYVDTFGSNFDTTVRIFSGSCPSLGANAACFDDACSILQTQGATQLAAGTYCLVLDQYSSSQTNGTAVLTFTRGGRTGAAFPATSGTVTGTTVGGVNTTQAGTCAVGFSQGADAGHYFMVCPSTTRTVTAATCTTPTSWDSVLYLRKGAAGSADVGCNDDGLAPCGTASPIRLSSLPATSAVGPGLFWLIVDGYNGASGAYTLTYTIN